jgi:hypothetical protein
LNLRLPGYEPLRFGVEPRVRGAALLVNAGLSGRRALREWLERHWNAVAAVLLLVVGAMPLAKGLVALG